MIQSASIMAIARTVLVPHGLFGNFIRIGSFTREFTKSPRQMWLDGAL